MSHNNGLDMILPQKREGITNQHPHNNKVFSGDFASGNTPMTSLDSASKNKESYLPADVQFTHEEMQDFVNNVSGKVDFAKETNQNKLKKKILLDLNRLNREERTLQKLEIKYSNQDIEVNESSMIKKDLADLESLEKFSNNMEKQSQTIQSQIQACHSRIADMKAAITTTHTLVRTTNSTIMAKSAQKQFLLQILNKFKKKEEQEENKKSNSDQINKNNNTNQTHHTQQPIPINQNDVSFDGDNYLLTSVPQNNNTNNNTSSIQFTKSNAHLTTQASIDKPRLKTIESSKDLNHLKYKILLSNNPKQQIRHASTANKRSNPPSRDSSEKPTTAKKLLISSASLSKLQRPLPPMMPTTQRLPINDNLNKDDGTQAELHRATGINDEIKQYIIKKSNGYLEMKRLLHDCFVSSSKRVAKQQQVSSQQHGLANSIIFEINPCKSTQPLTQLISNPHLQISCGVHGKLKEDIGLNRIGVPPPRKNLLQHTQLQDRELRNILYDTMKHIKATKIEEEEHEAILDRLAASRIPYSEFKEFSSDQILSLLLVRPSLLQQLLKVFDIKEKAMNLFIMKAKLMFMNPRKGEQVGSTTMIRSKSALDLERKQP